MINKKKKIQMTNDNNMNKKKMKFKRILPLVLSLALAFSVAVPSFSATEGVITSTDTYGATSAQNIVSDNTITTVIEPVTTSSAFGILKVDPYATISKPNLYARSAVIYSEDLDKIIYSKNMYTKIYPYSTTKLITALVVMDQVTDLNQIVTLGKYKATAGESLVGFKKGEKVRIIDLLYAMLMPSGNDAAYHLAIAVSGSVSGFSKLMNLKAKEIGATRSHFVNPSGMHSSKHYSTAYDMMLITKAAMSNFMIRQICGTEKYVMPKTNKHKARKIYTTDSFLVKKSYQKYGVLGGKTGTWSYLNCCMAVASTINGHTYYAVVMKTSINNRYNDMIKLLTYGAKKVAKLELAN